MKSKFSTQGIPGLLEKYDNIKIEIMEETH
jgi:hypothetical protein